MTRRIMTEDDRQAAAARRKSRHRSATLMLRGGISANEITAITGLAPESVFKLQQQESHRICDAKPNWQQILYGMFKGVMPHPRNPKLPASPPTNACADCVGRFIKYFNMARRDGTPAHMAVTCLHHGGDGTKYNIAFARQGKVCEWIEIGGVDPTNWNQLYFELAFSNAHRFAAIQEDARQVGQQVAAQVWRAHRDRTVQALKLLEIAARTHTRLEPMIPTMLAAVALVL